MTQFFISLATVALLSTSASAALLTPVNSSKTLETVNLSKSAKADLGGGATMELTTVGAGLRQKKVALFNVKVYVAELLSSDSSTVAHADSTVLASLDNSRTVAFRLSFLRAVDAPTVQKSFEDALVVNKVDINAADIKAFLANVKASGDANSGKTMVILTNKEGNKDAVYFEDTNGKVTKVVGNVGLARSIQAIWMGVPADAGLVALKAALTTELKF